MVGQSVPLNDVGSRLRVKVENGKSYGRSGLQREC